mgnify:CR=1 FL=1
MEQIINKIRLVLFKHLEVQKLVEVMNEIRDELRETENTSNPVEAEVSQPSEPSFGQWIEAEYKLPDDGEEVIFINPDKHIRIGEYSDDEFMQGYWVNKCEQYLTKDIKRWMPLPKS